MGGKEALLVHSRQAKKDSDPAGIIFVRTVSISHIHPVSFGIYKSATIGGPLVFTT